MPVQTSYTSDHLAAYAGQRRDLTLVDIISKAAEGGDIPFGLAIVPGTAADQCKLPSAAAQRFLGISEYTSAGLVNASDEHQYEEKKEVNILTFGYVWVIPEDAVTEGEQAYFRHTAPGTETLGAVTNNADGGNCDLIPGGVFETSADAGALAVLNLKPQLSGVTLYETVTTDAALSISTKITYFDTTGGATANVLPDGFEGQEKTLQMSVDGGTDSVVTPTNLTAGATLTFADAGDKCVLRFSAGSWDIIFNSGVVVA